MKFRFDWFERISSAYHKGVVAGLTSGFVFTYCLTSGHMGLELRLSHELFVHCTNNNSTAHQSQEEQDKDFLEVTYCTQTV